MSRAAPDAGRQGTDAPELSAIRGDILELARRYHAQLGEPRFVPGETYVPVSGKVLSADDLAALIDASLDLWLTADRFNTQFEQQLSQRLGNRKVATTASGSAANLVAFSALTSPALGDRRILPGSEVIAVAAGFPTTVAPIVQNGCIPVFVDVDLQTHNIDATQLPAALSHRTRAIMVAHALGNPFDLDAVTDFARKHDLFLIEDCCDALGATYRGEPVGTFGDLGTLSFYPAHHITTGEGGAVFGRPALVKIAESFRDWGRDCWCAPGDDNTCGKRFQWQLGGLPAGYDHKYSYSHLGYNLKMTDLQAAIGNSQLAKVDDFIERRRHNHDYLARAFKAEGLDAFFHLPEATPNSNPSWFGFALNVKDDAPWDRNQVTRFLEERRVGTRLMFGGNLARQPAFDGVNFRTVGSLTQTDRVMNSSFWIGVWPGLDKARLDYVISAFRELARGPR